MIQTSVFFPSLKYSLRVFAAGTKSYDGGNGTVCSCHVTYTFQIESTLSSCLNVKELLS